MVSMYMWAVSRLNNIDSIEHKFLVQGHTENEGDSVHSVIEKEIKKYLSAQNVFHPVQYETMIQNAKKTGAPYNLIQMRPNDFFLLKDLRDEYNLNLNKLKIKDVAALKIRKSNPYQVQVKYNFTDRYEVVDVRKNNRDPVVPELEESSARHLPLKKSKYDDLMYFVHNGLVPQEYLGFYENLSFKD